jgi:hypothetical protein
MKLVSFLMPSRHRHEWLERALRSIDNTALDRTEVEVVLKVDADQPEREWFVKTLNLQVPVRVVVSDRGKTKGGDMLRFTEEMLSAAQGKWSWFLDDDAWLVGNWQPQLRTANEGKAYMAEFYELGGSCYPFPYGVGGMVVPTAWAKSLENYLPIDYCWFDECHKQGRQIEALRDIHWHHDGRGR